MFDSNSIKMKIIILTNGSNLGKPTLTQYTTGIIPKGTPIKVGIVGPQGGFYGGIYSGGGIQFRVNSNSVVNQATKIVP